MLAAALEDAIPLDARSANRGEGDETYNETYILSDDLCCHKKPGPVWRAILLHANRFHERTSSAYAEVKRMLGSNVSTVGGLLRGLANGQEWECACIQVYLTLSRRWAVAPLRPDFCHEFQEAWAATDIRAVVAHVPFLVNLASPDTLVHERSIERLATEVGHANTLGVQYVVLHPGSARGTDRAAAVARVSESLNEVRRRNPATKTMVLIETMARQGDTLAGTFDELAAILNGVDDPPFVGVCFDTAHVFAAGYDLRGYDGYHAVMERFNAEIGTQRIRAFHVNDSKVPLGGRADRHAAIGEGEIGLQAFHALVRDDRFTDVPKILEIPERDTKSLRGLQLLRRLQETRESVDEPTPRAGQLPLYEVFG